MSRFVFGLVSAAGLILTAAQAEAQPMVATYMGLVLGTSDPFTAAFHYDTSDLVPSLNPNYLEAKPGTQQWASYSTGAGTVTFADAIAFSKGEYLSFEYSPDGSGAITASNTVHEYTLTGGAGMLSFAFGGANDMGMVSFADGTYANLDPQFFSLTKDVVSPVPLPAPVALFAGGLMVLGLMGYARRQRA